MGNSDEMPKWFGIWKEGHDKLHEKLDDDITEIKQGVGNILKTQQEALKELSGVTSDIREMKTDIKYLKQNNVKYEERLKTVEDFQSELKGERRIWRIIGTFLYAILAGVMGWVGGFLKK